MDTCAARENGEGGGRSLKDSFRLLSPQQCSDPSQSIPPEGPVLEARVGAMKAARGQYEEVEKYNRFPPQQACDGVNTPSRLSER